MARPADIKGGAMTPDTIQAAETKPPKSHLAVLLFIAAVSFACFGMLITARADSGPHCGDLPTMLVTVEATNE